ncbi:hypothetical protein R6Q57_005395 [Mikania cordata]
MATVFSSPSCTVFNSHKNPNPNLPASVHFTTVPFSSQITPQFAHRCISIPNSYRNASVFQKRLSNLKKTRFPVAEEGTVITEQEQGEVEATVAVPVSRSDVLTMFFHAEGTMSEAAIPSVTSAIEETEGIFSLRVQVLEGIASVELKKKTTVQATGVASNLVEIIQNSGFKLQALNLSFDEDAS